MPKRRFYQWGPWGLAILLLLALVLWMLSGDVKTARDERDEIQAGESGERMRVHVRTQTASAYQPSLVMQGQVEPWQYIDISARTEGVVEELRVRQGQRVERGETLLRISMDDRTAAAEQARARVRQLQSELDATDRLRSNNLVSQSEKLRLESELAAARAELRRAELALSYLEPRAPFSGVINRRDVETGNFVRVGDPLLQLVQVERLKVTARAPQKSVSRLREGQAVQVDLLDGRTLQGRVSFVASAADEATRTFMVEVEVDNPERLRIAGGSATLNVSLAEEMALFISPAYLTLDDNGRMGVHHVDASDTVQFTPVQLLSATTEGAWVTGLPPELRLITQGSGFVEPGDSVEPVAEDPSETRG